MNICQHCGEEIPQEQTNSHLVRAGYSLRQFPLLSYKRIILCQSCYQMYQKKDTFEKILAIIMLVIVVSLIALGYFMLFGLI